MPARFALFGLFILCSLAATTQSAVLKGWAHDQGEPLAKATVSLKNTPFHVTTDSAGYFAFTSLPEGRYVLQVTMVGYEPVERVVTLKEKDVKELKIELQAGNNSLNEVVVTGTMKPVQKLQSPIAVEVYTPQFFKKNPVPSIFEALQNVNGVRPQINCSVCNTGDIHINGLEGPYTMVTIDGMPIVSSLSSVYGLFGIPSQLIERVEIVKGPASGLYGSEAIGGLINIITKSPEKAPLFSANIMSTSWSEHLADLGLKWKLKEKAVSILGINYYNYQRPFDKNRDAFTDATLQHRVSVFNKWSFVRRQARQASLAARYFYEDRWGGDMRWGKEFRGGDSIYGESIYTNRWELIGNYQLPVRGPMFFSFSATAHRQNSYYGITPFLADQKILFGQYTWNKALGSRHDGLLGLAGRYNFYDDNSTATIDTATRVNKPERYFIPGLFLQDEWKLNEQHQLLLGLRLDYHPAHKEIITPRIAYKWKVDNGQVLRLNAGTGFRVVNLFTEDHAALTGAREVEIKERLKPEKSYNINVNYTRQVGNRSRQLALDASLWYTYFHNQIIADYEAHPNKIVYDNLKGHALSRGATVNLEFSLWQRLRGNAGFTFQDVTKVEKDALGKKVRERPMLTEKWSGTWSVSYTLPSPGLTFDYTGNIYGPMRLPLLSHLDPRRASSPVWSIQNIQATKWLSSKVEVYGGVKNLLNWTPARGNPFLIARTHDPFDKQVEYDAAGKVIYTAENPYALTFDPAYIYAPNQGIRFFMGVRFKVQGK